MYPFMSLYPHLMRAAQMSQPSQLSQPGAYTLPSLDVTGLGGARPDSLSRLTQPASVAPVDPFAPDDESRRRARNQGLVGLGGALLEASSSGDIASGVGRGIQAFVAGREGSLDRDRGLALARAEESRRAAEEGRRVSAEGRASAQEADRDASHDLDMNAGRLKLTAFEEEQARDRQKREATGKSAARMVDEIRSLAAATPDDPTLARMAKRAEGYALGDDTDLTKLDAIYGDMVGRAGREGDADWAMGQKIEQARKESEYGFGPIAEGRRAEAGIDLDKQRTAIYGQQISKQGTGSGGANGDVKPASWYDDVNKELNTLIDPWLKSRTAKAGEWDMTQETPTKFPMPTPEEIAAERRRLEPVAIENVNRLLGTFREGRDERTSGGGAVNEHQRPSPDTQPKADRVRNVVMQQLMSGASREEAIRQLRARGERIYGYTPEQYIDNAIGVMARRRAGAPK